MNTRKKIMEKIEKKLAELDTTYLIAILDTIEKLKKKEVPQ